MKNNDYFNLLKIGLIVKIIALALTVILLILVIGSKSAFGQTKPQNKIKKKAEKQVEFVLNYELQFDSITVVIPWIRLQENQEISSLSWILKEYLQKSGDTLWLEIPKGYTPFSREYPDNKSLINTAMVEIRQGYSPGFKKEDEEIFYIPESEIIGNRFPICTNTKKERLYIYIY